MEELALVDWLLSPIDHTRRHEVNVAESWHGRLMVFAWVILVPSGVIAARYFKITPRQNWPRELDNRTWWHTHLWLQWTGALVSLAGLIVIFRQLGTIRFFDSPHHFFGWLTMGLMVLQIFTGLFRGSAGGPTYPAPDGSWRGDHFDMTRRRKIFEYSHKFLGYVALASGVLAILFGLHAANAPIWMWGAIMLWWVILLGVAVYLQVTLGAVDTYQAIWGADPELPGNRVEPIGFGIKRLPPGEKT